MNTRKTLAHLLFCAVLSLLACSAFAADPPLVPPPAQSSRYIFMPRIDDGGKSSGPHAVSICLPNGYDSTDRCYPVIYLLDGESSLMTRQNGMRDTIGYEMVHDQLVHEGLIEPAIFVAIHNSTDENGVRINGNRFLDYCMTGQTAPSKAVYENKPDQTVSTETVYVTKSEGYYEYLAKTIKPMIDKTYRTRTDPASTGVAGFSAGGAGAFWMTYFHPETFGMGICQSPPFMAPYAGKELQAILSDTKRPVPPIRLWFDAGSREYDFIYKDAYAAYRKLIAQGFRMNENIAFYTGHNHGHEKFDCNRRLRAGLYFMLRAKTPQLTSVEINDMDAETSGVINLTRPVHPVLETVYDNWFRLTDCTAEFSIANAKIASFDKSTNQMTPITAGHTAIASSYDGRKITRQITIDAPAAQQSCYAAKNNITIDGNLSDWAELAVKVDKPLKSTDAIEWKGPADLTYRFDCRYDDSFFYIAIQATDDRINSVPGKDPWFQDGIEVRLDARPESMRMFGQGKEFQDVMLIAMSPAKTIETSTPYNAAKLPAGVKAVCLTTPTGHNTEIAIPIAYLNEKAGKPWTAIRMNVVVNDFDDNYKDFKGDKLWWQPDWRTPDSTWGSGTFVKTKGKR